MVSKYDFEKFSLIDVEKFLEQKNIETQWKLSESGQMYLFLLGTKIYLDAPLRSEKPGGIEDAIMPAIHFSGRSYLDEDFDEQKKVYQMIARKFRASKGVRLSKDNIKDWSEICRIKDDLGDSGEFWEPNMLL